MGVARLAAGAGEGLGAARLVATEGLGATRLAATEGLGVVAPKEGTGGLATAGGATGVPGF